MKKIFFLLLFLVCFSAHANTPTSWSDIYQEVINAFVYDVEVESLAINVLKGLNKVDKHLRIGNDSSRVTLYYRGKVVKVLRKPENRKDVSIWGNITTQMIDAAVETSSLASEIDFKIESIVVAEMIKSLDKDSKFYDDIDEANGLKKQIGRTFAVRREGNNLYIKILAFNKQTLFELEQAFDSEVDYEAIIIDLRGCSGGMLGMAIDVADMFLNDGIIASTKGKKQNEEVYYNANLNEEVKIVKPLFILVDKDTASSAEIFAAALQEQGIAKVIGTQTKGKGTMQKLISLPNGGVLAITNGFFMKPSGAELNEKGIIPDICTFEMPETKDVANLINQQDGTCQRESRIDSELEFKVVDFLITQ